MKQLVIVIVSFLILTLFVYAFPEFQDKVAETFSYSKCDKPTSYKLGTIDSRFNLSDEKALEEIKIATDIWNSTKNKELFAYSSKADLTISFVYDERQALDTKINELNNTLNQKNSTLQQQINEYKTQVAAFEKKINEFNAKVEYYNKQGGAPPEEFDKLVKEQETLAAEGNALNARAKELNLSTSDYNSQVSELNQDVSEFNNALSLKPEQGIYNGKDNTIIIYFVGNRSELLHTLAHEFGHALGIGHVGTSKSIMYPYTSTSITASVDDIIQLNYACREQSLFVHLAQEFDLWLLDTFDNIQQNLAL